MNGAIGGYFELELPKAGPFLYPAAYAFQSARAAFLALLRVGKPERVWMPRYICDSVIAPLVASGVKCDFYSVDENFDVIEDFEFRETDWIFYVNYFGICNGNVDRLLTRFKPTQIVLDHSQAFYAKPKKSLATIYSPRKFFGVPDGGLLLTEMPIIEPVLADQESLGRARYGMTRLAVTPEAGYADYQKAESSLDDLEPRKMSQLSQRILHSVRFDDARLRRNENFKFLHLHLGMFNGLSLDLAGTDGPLCYPFLIDSPGLREHLIEARVFVATYWPEAATRPGSTVREAEFVKNLLPLPCDQRYGPKEMQRMVAICLDFTSGKENFERSRKVV